MYELNYQLIVCMLVVLMFKIDKYLVLLKPLHSALQLAERYECHLQRQRAVSLGIDTRYLSLAPVQI